MPSCTYSYSRNRFHGWMTRCLSLFVLLAILGFGSALIYRENELDTCPKNLNLTLLDSNRKKISNDTCWGSECNTVMCNLFDQPGAAVLEAIEGGEHPNHNFPIKSSFIFYLILVAFSATILRSVEIANFCSEYSKSKMNITLIALQLFLGVAVVILACLLYVYEDRVTCLGTLYLSASTTNKTIVTSGYCINAECSQLICQMFGDSLTHRILGERVDLNDRIVSDVYHYFPIVLISLSAFVLFTLITETLIHTSCVKEVTETDGLIQGE